MSYEKGLRQKLLIKRMPFAVHFKIYTIPRRIGLRGVQSEQIQANSSFYQNMEARTVGSARFLYFDAEIPILAVNNSAK